MRPLITEYGGLLVGLIVIYAENAGRETSQRDQAAVLRREVSRAGMTEVQVSLESMQIDGADASGDAVQFGVVPSDGKGDARVEQYAEVVRTVSVFPEIIGIDD